MEINGFEIEKYNVYDFNESHKVSTCPKCSHERKKKTDKCLSLYWDTGIGKCNHCGELIQLHTYKKKQVEKTYEIPKYTYNKLDEKVKEWFKSRGISEQTLSQAKVTQSKEWMPQTSKEENTINFNYFLNDEIVNIKYRDGRKNFKLYKGAEKIFYNLDSIRLSKECVIVEGEIDALSVIEAGYYSVVSVPNGFNLQGKLTLDYLDNYLDYFDNKEKIILCLDNDEAGRKGQEEFVRRLGAYRCFLVDLREFKDINEYLIAKGKESVLNAIKNAKEVPLENIVTLNQLNDELENFWLNGMPKGMQSGMSLFDEVYSAELGQYTIIVGVPQSGKSEFLDHVLMKYSLRHKVKIGYVSVENEPLKLHYDKLVQKLYGRKPDKLNIRDFNLAVVKQYISDNVFHVQFDKRYYLEEVLDKFRELYKRKGVKIFVIDPFNKVRLKEKIQNINDFTSEYHLQLDAFVKETNSHLYLVAHPTKSSYIDGSTKTFSMPSAYDIKGGGEHYDMSYNIIGVNRVYEQKMVHIKTLKVKFKHLGEQQKSVFMTYNVNNGRYEELSFQPDIIDLQTIYNHDKYDNSNWLIEEPKEEIEETAMKPNDEFNIIENGEIDSQPPF